MTQPETSPRPEIRIAEQAVLNGLYSTYKVHEDLGADGVNAVETNQFGDTALVADVQSEVAMLDTLRQTSMAFKVHSEEHGQLAIDGTQPRLLAVMDGLDGSSLYKKERGSGLYGSMLAIFENDDPAYDQYLAAGIMLHSTGQLLLAVKGQGVRCINVADGSETTVRASDQPLAIDSLIFTDDDATVLPSNSLYPYFQANLHTWAEPLRAAGYETRRTGSSAGYYGRLALGQAALVGEATRKGNLELATAYALTTEAGGQVVAASNWQDIGRQRFLEFGQDSHQPFVAVANEQVLTALKQLTAQ